MEKTIKAGPLYKLHKGGIAIKKNDWRKCNGTLTETDNDGILILKSPNEKDVVISLQSCTRVLDAGTRNSRDHVIELLLQKKVLHLSCDSLEESRQWMDILIQYSADTFPRPGANHLASTAKKLRIAGSEPSAAPPKKTAGSEPKKPTAPPALDATQDQSKMEYNIAYEDPENECYTTEVLIRPSPLAETLDLNGVFSLVIDVEKLSIYSAKDTSRVFSWAYKTIRKYGRDKNSFSMEVGRRSSTGPGVLAFTTDQGNEIFHKVQKNTVAINSRPASAPASSHAAAANPVSKSLDSVSSSSGGGACCHAASAAVGGRLTKTSSVPSESEYSTIEDSRMRPQKTLPKNVQPLDYGDSYCRADEIKEDGWKKFGRAEANEHTEVYFGVEQSQVKPSRGDPSSAIYRQVNRRPPPKNTHPKPDVSATYSVLEVPAGRLEADPYDAVQNHEDTNMYDHLSRSVNSAADPFESGAVPEFSEYDHLQRSFLPNSGHLPEGGQEEEDLYHNVEKPPHMVDLVEDSGGYMINKALCAKPPEESLYDTTSYK